MKKFNINPYLLPVIKDMLQIRIQFVNFNNSNSDFYEFKSGFIQGGVSSHHYFYLFVNDSCHLLILNIFQYADDVVRVKIIYGRNDCMTLQNDLNNILNYTKENFITLNPSKSQYLRIVLKKNILIFSYTINNKIIDEFSHHKHLGVIYDEN
jgi:hypothetical protein